MKINVNLPKGCRVKSAREIFGNVEVEVTQDVHFGAMGSPRIVKQERYEVGDRVVVSGDVLIRERFGNCFVIDDIRRFANKTVTITGRWPNKNPEFRYQVDESYANWTADMFSGKLLPAVREVKRAAKVGEWVKVVRVVSPAYYKVGDIRQVVAVGKNWVDINVNAQDGFKPCLYHSEYIVLENYVPSEDKPSEPEPKEPMAVFYCYKSYKPGEWLTEGKTYTLDADGFITYDDGDCFKHNSENDLRKNGASFLSPYLATESKRPARVGDDVLVVKKGCHGPAIAVGEIRKVTHITPENHVYVSGGNVFQPFEQHEYVVLDHYHPDEPQEKHPLERVEKNDKYLYIGSDGGWGRFNEDFGIGDDTLFSVANYAADTEAGRKLLEQRAMHETLSRLLWRFAEMHGGVPEIDKPSGRIDLSPKPRAYMGCGSTSDIFTPRFVALGTAQLALDEVVKPYLAAHPDFKW